MPLIPLYSTWDGYISGLRTHQPEEFQAIAQSVTEADYEWRAGKVKNGINANVAYLVGTPRRTRA